MTLERRRKLLPWMFAIPGLLWLITRRAFEIVELIIRIFAMELELFVHATAYSLRLSMRQLLTV